MKIVAQRVLGASVTIDDKVYSNIQNGLLILVGFTEGDTEDTINYMVKKVLNLRIFDDENGVMNKSVKDINGSILSVSQFTLYADALNGNRPSYAKALNSENALPLYEIFNNKLKESNLQIGTGIFGAEMKVSLVNDGPVTIIIEK